MGTAVAVPSAGGGRGKGVLTISLAEIVSCEAVPGAAEQTDCVRCPERTSTLALDVAVAGGDGEALLDFH